MNPKQTLGKILTYGSIIAATIPAFQSCSTSKQIGENTYKFKNQELIYKRNFDFQNPQAKEDSTLYVFTNTKQTTFQIRIAKRDETEVISKINSNEKFNFLAKKKGEKYIINVESLKKEKRKIK